MKKTLSRLSGLTILGIAGLIALSFGQTRKIPKRAPTNRGYLEYLAGQTIERALPQTAEGHALGEIPSPVDISPVRPVRRLGLNRALPSSYDLRTAGKLTAIRDQGGCGSCWAFASMGSLESYLLPGEAADYSEQHLIDNAGYDYGPCDGGFLNMSAGYLTRWAGPIAESDDPYVYAAADGASLKPKKHVQNVIFYPQRTSSTDNDDLKTAITSDGAVYVTMWWSDGAFNDGTDSYYYGNASQTNGGGHAVCIVGWDDNYSSSRFNTAPPGDGAFIVRNSWGPTWGENGYFYVSYYDTFFARRPYNYNGLIRSEAVNDYAGVFQYDPLGWVGSWGYGPSYDTAWGANIFTAPVKSTIAAVGFQTVSANCSYEIYVYAGVAAGKPRSGILKASAAGSVVFPGFYTIPLPAAAAVAAGQRFSVVVKFTTPGYYYPVATEEKSGFWGTGKATASNGQSFLDYSGSIGTAWEDLSANTTDRPNCCIKAYTATPAGLKVLDPAAGAKWIRGTTQAINWTVTGALGATVKIELFKGTAKVSDIAAVTDNDGAYDWPIPPSTVKGADYTIKITTSDGQYKATSGMYAVTGSLIKVTSPTSGTRWKKGAAQSIFWTSAGPQDSLVRIQVLRNGVLVREIAAGASNSGACVWTIPSNLAAGTGYKIRVKTMDNQVKGDSPSFSLVN